MVSYNFWSFYDKENVTSNLFLDLVGDEYSANNPNPKPDDDPMDNCSASSHGIY